jgi:membrane protease YdiL (CAAX protease family)
VLGVSGNASVFATVAMIAAFRRPRERPRGLADEASPSYPGGWARLRIRPAARIEILAAILGLVALTSALDSLVQLVGLAEVGRLAEYRSEIGSLDIGERALLAALLGFGAGIAEELFFRGFMLTRLELAHGPWIALAITSIVFGLFHWDVVHTPLAALMGVYLGLIVLFTGSLVPAIAAHIINNIIATLFVDAELSDAAVWSFFAAGFPLALLVLAYLRQRSRAREIPAPVW